MVSYDGPGGGMTESDRWLALITAIAHLEAKPEKDLPWTPATREAYLLGFATCRTEVTELMKRLLLSSSYP